MITGLKAGESPEIVYRSLDAENRANLKVLTEIRASILRRRQRLKDDSGDQDESQNQFFRAAADRRLFRFRIFPRAYRAQ